MFDFGHPVPLYQQKSSPEVDKAWRDLYPQVLTIPASQAAKLPNKTAPVNGEDPNSEYIVSLSVFHNLHCLDAVRRTLWQTYPEDGLKPANISGHVYEERDEAGAHVHTESGSKLQYTMKHLAHCIDGIRQQLMCDADVSPIVWQWSNEHQDVRIKTDTLHTCRNYDAILKWGQEHEWYGAMHYTGKPKELGGCRADDGDCV